MLRYALALGALFMAQGANAGQWETVEGDPWTGCQFRFTGQILPGDLTGYMDQLSNGPAVLPRICLDSPGGSLSEVYRFIKGVNDGEAGLTVATRVESGAVCESSCAILFMFGQTFGANSPYPSREVEPGARLGFHSPFIAPGQGEGARADEVFRVALDVSKLLADSSYKALTAAGPALPPELVGLVLGTPGDEMRYVDTVGELQLLGIDMIAPPEEGVVLPNARGALSAAVTRICASSYVLTNRTHFVEEGYDFADLVAAVDGVQREAMTMHHLEMQNDGGVQRVTAMASGPFFVPGWYSAGAVLFCQVDMGVEPVAGGLRVTHYNVGFGGPSFDWDSRLAEFEEIERNGLSVGLVPIDTPFR